MKKLGLIAPLIAAAVLAVSCSTTLSGDIPTSMQQVIEVPGKSADDLFVLANTWMVDSFRSAESVIQYTDKEAGTLIGKYVGSNVSGVFFMYSTSSTITIEVREGRARITFDNPMQARIGRYDSVGTYSPCSSDNVLSGIREDWTDLIASFESALTAGGNDDW